MIRKLGSGGCRLYSKKQEEEVDAVMEQARLAGARIVKPAANMFWGGYAGCFQDPDDHRWEVVWNPQMSIE